MPNKKNFAQIILMRRGGVIYRHSGPGEVKSATAPIEEVLELDEVL